MAYQKALLATSTVFEAENNGVWTLADINGDGSPDLVYIKNKNTASNRVEVHGSPNESRFQTRAWTLRSGFVAEDNGTWLMKDWNGDKRADLVYIKTRNTSSGKTEVHIADAKSMYQNLNHYVSCFGTEEDGVWDMASTGDLIYIKYRNTQSGMVEVHAATRESKYKKSQSWVTGFQAEDNGTWCLATGINEQFRDLYYIKTRNTGSGKAEVHAASAVSAWKDVCLHQASSLPAENNGRWLMTCFSHQQLPDLVYIKTNGCSNNRTEVYVVEPKVYTPQPFIDTGKNIRLDGNVLSADLKRNDDSYRSATVDLNYFLGNVDGHFAWNGNDFSGSARDIRLEGTVISAELRKIDESWTRDSFDLRNSLKNNDGVFQAVNVPAVLAIPNNQQPSFLDNLAKALEDPNLNIQACEEKDGATVFYVNAGVKSSPTIFRTWTADATASVMHLAQSKGKPIEQVNVDVFNVSASATAGSYFGADLNASLFKAEASIFDLTLGVGLDTGAGIKDDSFVVEAAGCGVTIGRKVAISVFGSSFGIDIGRFFG